jgi:hypothetical protein
MTQSEVTKALNLARALNLIVASRTVNGALQVYSAAGYARSWESFNSEYPLERLQAMAERMRLRGLAG